MREGKRFRMVGYINQFTVPNVLIFFAPCFLHPKCMWCHFKNQLKAKPP